MYSSDNSRIFSATGMYTLWTIPGYSQLLVRAVSWEILEDFNFGGLGIGNIIGRG